MTASPSLPPPVVELRYRWEGGMFVNAEGEQLHEDLVPDVDCLAVLFSYVRREDDAPAAREAAEQIATWLREDRGALVVQIVPVAA